MMKKRFLFLTGVLLSLCACGGTNSEIPESHLRFNNIAIRESKLVAGAIDVFVETLDKDADIYYLFVDHEAKAPAVSQIIEGKDYDGVKVLSYGSEKDMVYKTVTGFDELAWIDFYCVLQQENKISDIYSTSVMTLDAKGVEDKGDGTLENPYRIYTVEDLEQVGAESSTLSAYYELQNDLDLSAFYGEEKKSFTPIGTQTGSAKAFNGSFNGKGYTISNLYINSTSESTGLFGQLGADGVISNLNIENAKVYSTQQRTGIVVGYSKGTVANINVINGTIHGTRKVGGAIGDVYETGLCNRIFVKDTYVKGTGDDVGGLIGCVDATAGDTNPIEVKNSYAIATVEGTKYAGGFIGYARCMLIDGCYAMVNITGTDGVGAFIGMAQHRSGSPVQPKVSNCFALKGHAEGTSNAGKFFGNFSTSNGGVDTSKIYYSQITLTAPTDKTGNYGQEITWFNSSNELKAWIENTQNIQLDFEYSWEIQENALRPTLKNSKAYDDGVTMSIGGE